MQGSHLETKIVHAGGVEEATGAVVPPIHLATTFVQDGLDQKPPGSNDPNSHGFGYEYQRIGNPTRGTLERALAMTEQASYAFCFSSGMSAISAIVQTLQSGDEIYCLEDVYGGTFRYLQHIATTVYHMKVTFCSHADIEKIPETTKMVWVETPTNPTLKMVNIETLHKQCAKIGAMLVVDNTFSSPFLQNPLVWGADVVVHSITKYIAGHSDVVMGALLCQDKELAQKIRFIQRCIGAVPSPFDCYMTLRGLKTLHVRLERAQENATVVARYLMDQEKYVEHCIYPGLEDYPDRHLVGTQMRGFGAMIVFYLRTVDSNEFLKQLRIFHSAVSLGAVESLAEAPYFMTHAALPECRRLALGITPNMIRLSIGIENVQDLVADLQQALDKSSSCCLAQTLHGSRCSIL